MKWEYQNRWLRLLIELFPLAPEIRRYRVLKGRREARISRALERRIEVQMQRLGTEY